MVDKLNGLERTHRCAELTINNVNQKVVLMGWVAKRRDLGHLSFIYLRDVSGQIQVVFNAETLGKELLEKASELKYEYVVSVEGVVRAREQTNINKHEATGEIEIEVSNLLILNTSDVMPFMLEGKNIGNENLRLEHRYLDIRRQEIKNNLILRSNINKSLRNYLGNENFIELETPILGKSTPEGARDYLVPSRVKQGKFYALPQSPQLYKQLFMIGGVDKYYQIAKCFRDEDLRADRQPEFTQVDIEMSFVDKEEPIITISEKLIAKVFKENAGIEIKTPFKKLTYKEAIENYGSDKPDLRFGITIKDITEQVNKSDFVMFKNAIVAGGSVNAINATGLNNNIARKYLDKLTEIAKTYGAKGMASIRITEEEVKTSLTKFLSKEEIDVILKATNAKVGDIILICADAKIETSCKALGAVRLALAEKFELINKDEYNFSWVTDFPMFEYSEEDKRYYSTHHPFTSPRDEDLPLLETNPSKVLSKAYDMVINGQEAGGGSIRISDVSVQERVFKVLSFTEEEIKSQFGFFVDAFKYGTPPHGGIAFGLDRLVMLLAKTENIKDVIAFPKIQNASCLMSKAPSVVNNQQLKELALEIKLEEKE